MLGTVLQIVGAVIVVGGVALLSIPAAVVLTGAAVAFVGYLLERE